MIHPMRVGPYKRLIEFVIDYLVGKHDLIGVEIGSYAGESTTMFLKSGAFKQLYCVDPWERDYDPRDHAGDEGIVEAEMIFDKRFSRCNLVTKIKRRSDEAISLFRNESLDFIYIDGNHTYEVFKKDLEGYVPKIKHGGIISGHDYCDFWPGVPRALDEYFHRKPLKVYQDGGSWVYIKD